MNDAETRAELIDPATAAAGWYRKSAAVEELEQTTLLRGERFGSEADAPLEMVSN